MQTRNISTLSPLPLIILVMIGYSVGCHQPALQPPAGVNPPVVASPPVAAPAVTAIRIENMHNEETICCPVAMLTGDIDFDPHGLSDPKVSISEIRQPITITNHDYSVLDGATSSVTLGRRFTLLAALVPGHNQLVVSCGKVKAELKLNYRPTTSPYQVQIAYVLPSDGGIGFPGYTPTTKDDYKEKLDTAAKLMQTFTAEQMNSQGLGRKTFNLELDAKGRVVVHTLRSSANKAMFRGMTTDCGRMLYAQLNPMIEAQFPSVHDKTLVIPATDSDTSGGGCGEYGMGLLEALHLASWPKHVSDVTLRDWRQANPDALTEIGIGLHELGHCFGCGHSADTTSIMNGSSCDFSTAFAPHEPGDSAPQWDSYDAARFYYLRWFQPELRGYVCAGPNCYMETPKELIIKSHRGIGSVNFHLPSDGKCDCGAAYMRRHEILFRNNTQKQITLNIAQIKAWIGVSDKFDVVTRDTMGNTTFTEVEGGGTTGWGVQ